jgi:DNA invertase Pin-like site-specific DNA recombinase
LVRFFVSASRDISDRLARSTQDPLNILAAIAENGAHFRSLSEVSADTKSLHGRLMLTVLGVLAEFERELIRARMGEGRARHQEWRQTRSQAKTNPSSK